MYSITHVTKWYRLYRYRLNPRSLERFGTSYISETLHASANHAKAKLYIEWKLFKIISHFCQKTALQILMVYHKWLTASDGELILTRFYSECFFQHHFEVHSIFQDSQKKEKPIQFPRKCYPTSRMIDIVADRLACGNFLIDKTISKRFKTVSIIHGSDALCDHRFIAQRTSYM